MKEQEDWRKQMAGLQQQYWEGWREMAGQAMAPAAQQANQPWQGGLDAWSRALGSHPAAAAFAAAGPAGSSGFPGAFGAASPFTGSGAFSGLAGGQFGQNELLERLMGHGKQYLELLQGLMNGQGFQNGGQFDPRAWVEQLRTLHQSHGASALGKIGAMPWFGGIDPAQVEHMVKSLIGAPMHGVQQELQGWLGMPAFGLAREHVERKQALARAWLDQQAASNQYQELLLKSAATTIDKLEGKLAEREQPGRQIDTVRALYDLWIDAAEEAFTDLALSAEYRAATGELVNTQMRVRAGINDAIERMGAQFGMPTRTEVDSLARQVHELKRELRRRRQGAGAAASAPSARTGRGAAASVSGSDAGARPASGQPAAKAKAKSKTKTKVKAKTKTKTEPKPKAKTGAKAKTKSKSKSKSPAKTKTKTKAKAADKAGAGRNAAPASTARVASGSQAKSSNAGASGRRRATRARAPEPPVMIRSTARKSAKGG